ncbi:hypothetical protein FQA39_LY07019 [Lamprigera yunnana]|nr:hypothetical protein FQA39_LY07019 [Lamprigera yunnana]
MFMLIISAFYTFAGISGFVAFLILGNYPSAVWAIVTGILSGFTTHLRWLKHKNYLNQWYDPKELIPLARVGFVFYTIGVMGVVYHTAIEILSKKPLLPVKQSEVICIVWSFMTVKSGILLMFTARSYCKTRQQENCLPPNLSSTQ